MSNMWIATLLKFSSARTSASKTTKRGTCLAMHPVKVAVAAVVAAAAAMAPHRHSAAGWVKHASNTVTVAVAVAEDPLVDAAVGFLANAAISRQLNPKLFHCPIPD